MPAIAENAHEERNSLPVIEQVLPSEPRGRFFADNRNATTDDVISMTVYEAELHDYSD